MKNMTLNERKRLMRDRLLSSYCEAIGEIKNSETDLMQLGSPFWLGDEVCEEFKVKFDELMDTLETTCECCGQIVK